MSHKPRTKILTQPDMNESMGNVNSLKGRVQAIENAWPAMSQRVASCEAAENALTTRVGTLETYYGSLEQRIAGAENVNTDQTSKISSLLTRMTAVESGADSFATWKAAKPAALGKLDASTSPLVGLSILGIGITVSKASLEAELLAIKNKINQHDDMFRARSLTQ